MKVKIPVKFKIPEHWCNKKVRLLLTMIGAVLLAITIGVISIKGSGSYTYKSQVLSEPYNEKVLIPYRTTRLELTKRVLILARSTDELLYELDKAHASVRTNIVNGLDHGGFSPNGCPICRTIRRAQRALNN